MTRAKRAFSYIRFSKPEQLKGDSLRRQLEWGVGLCAEKGWSLDDSLHLQDLGKSAFRGANAANGKLGAFIEAIKTGRVKPGDVLILEALDRLSREDIDPAWERFRSILKRGVEIYTREPPRHYLPADLGNFGTRIEVQAYMLRAYNESATKSMRGCEYWKTQRARISEGRKVHKVPPAWLRVYEDRKSFVVIPEAARAVKLVYRWAGEGMGSDAIARRLNKEGIPPIAKRPTWRSSYVAKILQDRAVLGEYQPHKMVSVPADPDDPEGPTRQKRTPCGEPVRDYFPAVIQEDEWYAVRQAVKGRGVARGRNGEEVANLFKGLIRDARDGCTMHLVRSAREARGCARTLISYGVRSGERGSVRMTFAYGAVEELFLATVRELKAADILGDRADDRAEVILSLTGKLQELDRKIAAVQKRVVEEEGIETLMSLLSQLDGQRKEVSTRLEQLKAEEAHQQPTALGEVQSLIDLLDKAQGDERRELRTRIRSRIQQLVSEMWVLAWDVTPTIRAAEVQIVFHSGKVRGLLLTWLRRGRHRGLTTGVGRILAEPGNDGHLEGKRLSEYRSDSQVREWFDLHHQNLAQVIQDVVDAEKKVRESQAALEALKTKQRRRARE